MTRTLVWALVAVAWAALLQGAVQGRSAPVAAILQADPAPLRSTNPVLQASMERIARRSRLWRDAVDGVRHTGRFALVLTPDQVVVAEGGDARRTTAFDESVVAEVSPLPDGRNHVRLVMVVVNLPLLQEVHRRNRSLPAEFDADLDRIVTHEIYGHALPYLEVGHMSGRCPDPAPGQRASDACAIQRENAVRAELGLGRRTTYGLDGLSLARSWWGATGD